MPTHYLYGTILTAEAVAANNRGDNIGNTTTLQKVFVGDDLHTSVSAEAIRFALRYRFQLQGEPVDRSFNVETGATRYRKDGNVPSWDREAPYIDDDLMGFMDAKAAQVEQESEGSIDEAESSDTVTKSELAPWPSVALSRFAPIAARFLLTPPAGRRRREISRSTRPRCTRPSISILSD